MADRRILPSAFDGDDGRPDVRLGKALEAFDADPGRLPEVLAALHATRVLTPVVALPGDTTSDIAVPLLEGTDGRRALPAFTSLASLARWDPAARPVPVAGPKAAQVARAEGAAVLVLDPAGPVSCALGDPELRALVEGRGAVPGYDDEELAGCVVTLAAAEPAVLTAWLLPWRDVDARLALHVDESAAADDAAALLRRLTQRLGDLPQWVALAVRGLDLTVLPGAETPARSPVFRRFLD